jgi:hypothetical protein
MWLSLKARKAQRTEKTCLLVQTYYPLASEPEDEVLECRDSQNFWGLNRKGIKQYPFLNSMRYGEA